MHARVKHFFNDAVFKNNSKIRLKYIINRCEICGNMEKNLNLKKTVDQVEEFDPIENSLEGKFYMKTQFL